jgi:hypothetical protein
LRTYHETYINNGNQKPSGTDCEPGRDAGKDVLLDTNNGKDDSNGEDDS